MIIDKAYLAGQRASLKAQQAQHRETLMAVNGALQLIDALEEHLEEPEQMNLEVPPPAVAPTEGNTTANQSTQNHA